MLHTGHHFQTAPFLHKSTTVLVDLIILFVDHGDEPLIRCSCNSAHSIHSLLYIMTNGELRYGGWCRAVKLSLVNLVLAVKHSLGNVVSDQAICNVTCQFC